MENSLNKFVLQDFLKNDKYSFNYPQITDTNLITFKPNKCESNTSDESYFHQY